MTLVTMQKQQFESMSDERLGWACIAPTLQQIRGREIAVKTAAIARLNKGQQALCMFRVLYDHAKNSAGEYYAWLACILDTPGYWEGVSGGLHFFDDQAMLDLLERTRVVIEARDRRPGVSLYDVSITDLDGDQELRSTITLLFEQFIDTAAHSLQQIAVYIRSHPQQFVLFEE
ncbi:hypothetical protein EBB07_17035 [Paenibacillaceae bacterium]|nr:hypothetical protein EBB07_17035 [Paenibacillaceae bacterium]